LQNGEAGSVAEAVKGGAGIEIEVARGEAVGTEIEDAVGAENRSGL